MPAPFIIPQTIWDQFLFPHLFVPRANQRQRPDLIHHTNNIVSFFGRTPVVVTIHDMTPFLIPEASRGAHGAYQRLYFEYASKKAARIITVSENSKKDICSILKVREDNVAVVPLAVDFSYSVTQRVREMAGLRQRFDLKENFILYAGNNHPRKNVGRVVRAFRRLQKKHGIPHKLVLAGLNRWVDLPELKGDGAMKDIICPGLVQDLELTALYSYCDLFVWPSLYEGFGLPVLEAMSFGAPVVTSNTSSLPEVVGDAAVMVDPYSVEAICEGMRQVIANSEFADHLRRKGRARARYFSWQKSAELTYKVYQSVLGSG
jgi:glycosyltransferase involved in cell wall biosynthesis